MAVNCLAIHECPKVSHVQEPVYLSFVIPPKRCLVLNVFTKPFLGTNLRRPRASSRSSQKKNTESGRGPTKSPVTR